MLLLKEPLEGVLVGMPGEFPWGGFSGAEFPGDGAPNAEEVDYV